MPKTRTQKETIVNELTDGFKRQKIAIFSDFTGISVFKLQSLRRLLKKSGAEYKIAKKTLFDRALEIVGLGIKTKELPGEVGVVLGYEDEVSPAKTLLKFSKENETFKLLGGILGGKILKDKEVVSLLRNRGRTVYVENLDVQTPNKAGNNIYPKKQTVNKVVFWVFQTQRSVLRSLRET